MSGLQYYPWVQKFLLKMDNDYTTITNTQLKILVTKAGG
jgi:hypothetical protein